MRNTFAQEITRLSIKNKKIVLLAGDIGNKLFNKFKDKSKNRFFNCGVAEANMSTVAAGLAYSGLIPITYTIASFNTYKIVEQIKLDICYPNLPVIIVGVGSGLSYSSLGTTHHSIEDIATLRGFPNLQIVCPADSLELKKIIPEIIKSTKPTYLRIGKKNEKNVYKNTCKSRLYEPTIVQKGKRICIFSTGNILFNIMEAAKLLENKIKPQIINIHTIKPINSMKIVKLLKKFKKIIIIEEHNGLGGLGSIIMEIAGKYKTQNDFININTGNKFLEGMGDLKAARKKLNMDSVSISKIILKLSK